MYRLKTIGNVLRNFIFYGFILLNGTFGQVGFVSGIVRDTGGKGLEGVKIMIVEGYEIRVIGETDSSGRYEVHCPANKLVTFWKEGYRGYVTDLAGLRKNSGQVIMEREWETLSSSMIMEALEEKSEYEISYWQKKGGQKNLLEIREINYKGWRSAVYIPNPFPERSVYIEGIRIGLEMRRKDVARLGVLLMYPEEARGILRVSENTVIRDTLWLDEELSGRAGWYKVKWKKKAVEIEVEGGRVVFPSAGVYVVVECFDLRFPEGEKGIKWRGDPEFFVVIDEADVYCPAIWGIYLEEPLSWGNRPYREEERRRKWYQERSPEFQVDDSASREKSGRYFVPFVSLRIRVSLPDGAR